MIKMITKKLTAYILEDSTERDRVYSSLEDMGFEINRFKILSGNGTIMKDNLDQGIYHEDSELDKAMITTWPESELEKALNDMAEKLKIK